MIGRKENQHVLIDLVCCQATRVGIQHYDALNSFLYQGPEYEKTIGECTCKIANIPESA
uniref:Uncharacterized protein n=1 Tax=Anguilla anguilla TaxID=7936 RepID=A0A0E9RQ11_ANGAN